jgi:competence protein ComGF
MATDVCSDRLLLNIFSSFYEDNIKWFVLIDVLLLSLVCLFSHSHIYVAVNVFLLGDIAVQS